MAGLQQKGENFYCTFRYLGKRHTFTVGNVPKDIAQATASRVDLLLYRLKNRLVEIPSGISVIDFIRFDGKPAPKSDEPPTPTPGKTSLGEFRDRYVATHKASLEQTTLNGILLHFKYFVTAWDEGFEITDLTLSRLQEYVDSRTKDAGLNGRTLSPATIKKEIVTLRTAWNWAKRMKIVTERFPYEGLRYPRSTEKPPFLTRNEITHKIEAGGLTKAEQADLWNAMYPTVEEIKSILKLVKSQPAQPFVYPMITFAAMTGARRSEIIRVKVTDIDLTQNIVTIHEKKKVKNKTTTRRVPISPFLAKILKIWLKNHPGGQYLFCQTTVVARSKKRSPTKGYMSGDNKPTTAEARTANLKPRETLPNGPLTSDEAHNHLKQVFKGTDWARIKGWHFFRHGFIGACATKSVDQRFIDEWVGHQTEEQRKRYRHLTPSSQQEALASVFG